MLLVVCDENESGSSAVFHTENGASGSFPSTG